MAEQQYINYGNTANDGTGDSLREAFIKVDENFTSIWQAGPVGSNIVITNNSITSTNLNGDIIISPSGIGVTRIDSTVIPRSNNVYALGSANARFRSAYVGSGGLNVTGSAVFLGDISVAGNISGNIEIGNTVRANVIGSVYGDDSTVLVDAVTGTHFGTFVGDGSGLTNVPSGSFVANGTSNIQIQQNSAVTVSIAGVSNVAVIDQYGVTIQGNLLPSANVLYDLGSPNQRWNTLYLAGNTIDLGGQTLTATANGIAITSGNVLQIGNAAIVATGNAIVLEDPAGGSLVIGGGDGNLIGNNLAISGNVAANLYLGNGAPLTSTLTDRGDDSNNWDTLTQMGVYKVNRTSWSGTQGTPLDSSIYVGLLQVLTAQDATTQIFLPGTVQIGDQKIQWNRSYWNGIWTGWIKMVNNGQIVDAGTY